MSYVSDLKFQKSIFSSDFKKDNLIICNQMEIRGLLFLEKMTEPMWLNLGRTLNIFIGSTVHFFIKSSFS